MAKTIVRYSEAFKLQVISELETGKLRNKAQARLKYGIGGGGTISCWLKKYGKNNLINKIVRIETVKEKDQLKEMKEKIRKLESALSDAHLDLCIERSYVELACETAGIDDIEKFKKKVDTSVLKKQ